MVGFCSGGGGPRFDRSRFPILRPLGQQEPVQVRRVVDELQEIRHDGEKQQFHAYMNVLKCHIAHLEEIVARQGEEIKRLR